ncbi:MAG TPA: PDZ domain-containing protein [Candidatus Polarisedimenticolaceae bacterium]|nr:PDZ domain-containing protein [Candidatus Polarisedimenticolaceae bacterium]
MDRRTLVTMTLLMLVPSSASLAGEARHRCSYPIQQCLDHMSSTLKSSGWVGIEFDDAGVPGAGYKIQRVVPGSPAEKAGLLVGDILYALNGVPLAKENEAALAKARKEWKPGQSVTYTIRREGIDREITLTLAPMPADVMAKWIGEHMMQHVAAERSAK